MHFPIRDGEGSPIRDGDGSPTRTQAAHHSLSAWPARYGRGQKAHPHHGLLVTPQHQDISLQCMLHTGQCKPFYKIAYVIVSAQKPIYEHTLKTAGGKKLNPEERLKEELGGRINNLL